MKPTPKGTPCDDGEKATLGDACDNGTCKPGVKAACKVNLDCDVQEDGDACNGTLYCDKTDGACKLNPATVIACAKGGDSACTKNTCDPASGVCSLKALKNGSSCNDNDKCTQNEFCLQGKCGGGEDQCPCTDDKSCLALDDGNLCNGTLFCNKKTKKCELNPASLVVCKSLNDTQCSKNACAPATGTCAMTDTERASLLPCPQAVGAPKKDCRWEVKPKAAKSDEVSCDDGDKCTANSSCAKGQCTGENTLCVCKSTADCAKQEDGDACNGTLYCNPKTKLCELNKATVVSCPKPKAGACIGHKCAPKTGQCLVQPIATGTPCDDGEKCTKAEYCVLGECKGGLKACECLDNGDCASKDDGDACNGVFFCDKSGLKATCKFAPGSAVVCPPAAGPCLTNTCVKATGKCATKLKADGQKCDDGEPCSIADTCAKGKCAGKANPCNDGNFCTLDKCAKGVGCQHTKNLCDDGNDCTADTCDAKNGKCGFDSAPRDAKGCNDGNGCSVGDVCKKGSCVAGAAIVCNQPSGACTEPKCVSVAKGQNFSCVVVARKDGATCDDGDACSLGSSCVKGACKAGTKLALWTEKTSLLVQDSSSQLRAVAVAKTGIYVGGVVQEPATGKPTKSTLWYVRVLPDGSRDWHQPVVSKKPHVQAGINAVVADPAGGVWALGTSFDAGLDGRVIRRTDAKKTLFDKTLGEPGTKNDAIEDGIANVGGGLLAAGWQNVGTGPAQGWLTALSANGIVGWKLAVGGAGDDRLHAVTLRSTGDVAAAGREGSSKSGSQLGWIVAASATGSLSWQRGYGAHAKQALNGVVGMKNGDLFAAGTAEIGGKSNRWLLRVRKTGQQLWSVTRSGHFAVTSLRWLAPERVVITGQSNPGSADPDGWVAALDATGNTTWETTYSSKYVDGLAAVAVLPKGGLLAVGSTPTLESGGKRMVGLMMRMDAWGNRTCAASGGCIGKAAGFCDDNTPCTRDRCVSANGKDTCDHATVPGMNCDTKDGCSFIGTCSGKTCEAGDAGRLFSRDYTNQPLFDIASVAAGVNGGFEVTGRNGSSIVTERFDDYGQPNGRRLVPDKSALSNYHHVGGSLPTADGGAVISYARSTLGSKTVPSTAYLQKIPGGTHLLYQTLWSSNTPSGSCSYVTIGGSKNAARNWYNAYRPPVYMRGLLHSIDGNHIIAVALTAGDSPECALGYKGKIGRLITKRCVIVRRAPSGANKLEWTGANICDGFAHDGGAGYGGIPYVYGQRTIDDISAAPMADGGVALAGAERIVATGARYSNARPYYVVDSLQPLLARLSNTGSLAWRKSFVVTRTAAFTRTVQTNDAGLLAGGWLEDAKGTRKVLLLSTFANGTERWRKSHLVLGAPKIAGLARLVGGDLLIGGSIVEGSVRKPWTARIDTLGNFLHQRTHNIGKGTATPATKEALLLTGDGGFILAGKVTAGSDRVFAVRGNAFGHATCKGAGKCSSQSPTDCSDGDPCTLDHCDPKKGCVHPKRTCADDKPCTLDKCHKDGTCKHTTNTCDDGDACTLDTCNKGVDPVLGDGCEHQKNACDDGNACTVDSCDKTAGCKHVPGNAGKTCFDAQCHVGSCSSGSCSVTSQVVPGCNKSVPGISCKVTKSKYKAAPDGDYWLDWGAADPVTKAKWGPRKFRCDMSGGGWTRIVNEDFETATGSWAKQLQCNASKVGCGALKRRFASPIHSNVRVSSSFLGKQGDSGCRYISTKYLSHTVKLDYCPSKGESKDVCSKHMKSAAVLKKATAAGKHSGYSVELDFNNGASSDTDPLSFCYDDLEVWVL